MSFWFSRKANDGGRSIYVVANILPYLLLLPVIVVALMGALW